LLRMKYFHQIISISFAFATAFLSRAPALHAAITDADLAKIKNLIQEGRTERAKDVCVIDEDVTSIPIDQPVSRLFDDLRLDTVASLASICGAVQSG
jgi:hypothetical protein